MLTFYKEVQKAQKETHAGGRVSCVKPKDFFFFVRFHFGKGEKGAK